MRRSEDPFSGDPEVEAALAVIDATLAGDPVEPEHAEIAELTLILAEQRPVPRPQFTAALDLSVQRRFAPPGPEGGSARHRRRRWLFAPGAMVGAAAAVAAVIVLAGGGHEASGPQLPVRTALPNTAAGKSAHTTTSARSGAPRTSARDLSVASSAGAVGATSGSASSSAPAGGSSTSAASSPAPAPHTAGRQVVQSAELNLSAAPSGVDDVAQEVFDVISAQNGIVQSSSVTATNNASGYAQFQLSVPSSNLQATMSALSGLHGASVVSRTDGSQDITGQVGGAGRRLAEARALRSSLLRQLAAATSQTQVNGLKAQIRDADAAISRDSTKLNALHHQVDNSQISVTINAARAPGHTSSGGGFTLGRAAHDAGRVLVVAAGVALIALAVLVPLALVGAVAGWVGLAVRRRRREQALDLV